MYWRLRTAAMFAMMTGLLVVIGGLVGYLFKNWMMGMVVMLGISLAFNLYSYFFSKKMALRMNKVQLVTREEEPRLYDIVQSLADRAGLPMPEVGISNVPMPNAFATGRNPKNAAVVATRPLLNLLTDDELDSEYTFVKDDAPGAQYRENGDDDDLIWVQQKGDNWIIQQEQDDDDVEVLSALGIKALA